MEIDKKQSKRKAPEDSDILTKEKKNREDARKNTKKSGKNNNFFNCFKSLSTRNTKDGAE